jgi:hypothetical protein
VLRLSIGARQAPAATVTHNRLLTHAKQALGEERTATQRLIGKHVPIQEAIDDALALVSEIHLPRSKSEPA